MAVQTLPFSNLIEIDRQSPVAVFKQVATGVALLIRSGKLKPGYQLPASRDLASILKLNRTTVVSAYDELQAQGWLEAVERKGVFVAMKLPVIRARSFGPVTEGKQDKGHGTDFYRHIAEKKQAATLSGPYQLMINDGYPDPRVAPLAAIYERHRDLVNRPYLHGTLMHDSAAGSFSLRKELAFFLSRTRALDIGPKNVLVTHGAQLAIYMAASMIIKPGSTVIVGEMNYILADKLFEQLGATLVKVGVDENGIDVDAIEEICNRSRPDLLYIIPHHHHPTTVTLSADRRVKLLELIRRFSLPVIEDDYDYDFHYDHSPILPLASAEHDGYVLYIGSISKTLAPTIRLGYLVGGEDFIWQASKLKQLVEIRGDVLFEESVAHLFSTGEMHRHIRRSVKLYKERRDAFCALLSSSLGDVAEFAIPQGGMAVWTRFQNDYSIPDLSSRLGAKGIYMNDGSLYRYKQDVNGVRLGFASLNPREMQRFFEALKAGK